MSKESNNSGGIGFVGLLTIHHNDVEYIRKDLYDDLKNQITAYQLTVENMESEHNELMKQEPVGYKVNDTKNNSEWITTIHNPEKYERDYPDFILTPIYARPLPAQQMLGKDKS